MPSLPPSVDGDKYIALVSGLGLARSSIDQLKVQLAVDWLSGMLGGPNEQVWKGCWVWKECWADTTSRWKPACVDT